MDKNRPAELLEAIEDLSQQFKSEQPDTAIPIGKWFACEDRLPPIGKKILASYWTYGNPKSGERGYARMVRYEYTLPEGKESRWFFAESREDVTEPWPPTHWMLIPWIEEAPDSNKE